MSNGFEVPMKFKSDTHVKIARGEHAGLSGVLCVYFFTGMWMFRPDGVDVGGVGHLWVNQDDVEIDAQAEQAAPSVYTAPTPPAFADADATDEQSEE